MRATCPHCGTYGPLEIFLADADAKAAVVAASQLPGDLPRLVWSYLGLFRRPGSSRVLTWERTGRLVADLAALVAESDIGWKGGRLVPNRHGYWASAIQIILDRDAQGKVERPLDGHNYLRAIAYELAERAWYQQHQAREAAAAIRPARTPQGPPGTPAGYQPVPASEALRGWRQRLGLAQEGPHDET